MDQNDHTRDAQEPLLNAEVVNDVAGDAPQAAKREANTTPPPTHAQVVEADRQNPVVIQVVACEQDDVDLKPDVISGVLCPTASILNHSGMDGRFSKIALLYSALMVFNGFVYTVNCIRDAYEVQEEYGPILDYEASEELDREINEEASYYNLIAFCSYILMCGLFFTGYYRFLGKRESTGPTIIGKLLYPVATVYYHEENSINLKVFAAIFLGPFYTLLCYKPSYEDRRETVLLAV